MNNNPKVSVIMKVYNGEKYLREAIDSVLNQSFPDFELLIIDDCSEDNSVNIIKEYDDERIILIQNSENQGIVISQNKLIDRARGEYIAVMDCDDISYPERLAKQVSFLDTHKNFIMCATYRHEIKDGVYTADFEIEHLKTSTIRFALLFTNPITHSSIMFRANMYRADGIKYGPERVAEDYGAIVNMSLKHPIAIIPERLVAYRIVSGSVSDKRRDEMMEASVNIRSNYLDKIPMEEDSKEILKKYIRGELHASDTGKFIDAFYDFSIAVRANISPGGNAHETAKRILTEFIQLSPDFSFEMWRQIRHSGFSELTNLKTDLGRKFFIASVLKYKH